VNNNQRSELSVGPFVPYLISMAYAVGFKCDFIPEKNWVYHWYTISFRVHLGSSANCKIIDFELLNINQGWASFMQDFVFRKILTKLTSQTDPRISTKKD